MPELPSPWSAKINGNFLFPEARPRGGWRELTVVERHAVGIRIHVRRKIIDDRPHDGFVGDGYLARGNRASS